MRSAFRDEFPRVMLYSAEFGDDALCLLTLEEGDEFLELSYSTDKICAVVAPYQGGFASTSDESSKGSDECVCGEI